MNLEVLHYKKLLSEVKGVIYLAMVYNPQMRIHFSRVWKLLEDNGIKCQFDKGGVG